MCLNLWHVVGGEKEFKPVAVMFNRLGREGGTRGGGVNPVLSYGALSCWVYIAVYGNPLKQ